MTDKDTSAPVPESWIVPEEEINENWNQQSGRFAYFKDFFRQQRKGKTPASPADNA